MEKNDCILFFFWLYAAAGLVPTLPFLFVQGIQSGNSFQRLRSRAQAFRHLGAMLGAEIHDPTLPSFKHDLVQKYANTRPGPPKHIPLKLRKSAQR